MGNYHHACEEHGVFEVYTTSWSAYEELNDVYGRGEGGSLTVPCPDCSGVSPRDYSAGVASVKGGMGLYNQENYRRGAEQRWLKNEVKNTKEVLKFKDHSPYSKMMLDPEKAGAERVSEKTAKARADGARAALGKHKETSDKNKAKRVR